LPAGDRQGTEVLVPLFAAKSIPLGRGSSESARLPIQCAL
jgi:hypothetical protein